MQSTGVYLLMATAAVLLGVSSTVAAPPGPPEVCQALKSMMEGKVILRQKCLNMTGADPEHVIKTHKGDFEKADNTTKCFMMCIMDGLGLIKDGNMDVMAMNTMLEKIAPPPMAMRAKKAFEVCKDTVGSDMCDTSHQFFKCVFTVDKEALSMF